MSRRTGVQVLLSGLVLSGASLVTGLAEEQPPGRPARQEVGSGTVSLDVHPQGGCSTC